MSPRKAALGALLKRIDFVVSQRHGIELSYAKVR